MDSGESFFNLRRFVKGKISKYQLMDSDSLIDRVNVVEKNPSMSVLYLDFGNFEKLGKVIGLSDDDTWFYNMINSTYSGYEIYDSNSAKDDFFQGYGPWRDINRDNLELFNKIHKYVAGKSIDIDDFEEMGKFAKKLNLSFKREIEDIIQDWTNEKNSEFQQVAADHVNQQINDFFKDYGMEFYGDSTLKTTVADLIALYFQYDIFHLSIKDMLKEVMRDPDRSIGGWDEDRYEYYDDNVFDKASFNREVERDLEKIIEKLEDEDSDSSSYISMIERVSSKFNQDTWYDLPKDKNYMFTINGFEREGNKISIIFRKKRGGELKRFKVSEDGLNRLLYYPELFNLDDL